MATLVYADHNNTKLHDATRASITAASKFGEPVTVLVAGEGCKAVADEASKVNGVHSVIHVESKNLGHQLAEDTSATIVSLQGAKSFTQIVGSTSASGKDVLPRVAAALDVSIVSDVIKINSNDTFVRPVYAGNALATVQSIDKVKVLTVRPTAFEVAAATGGSAAVESATATATNTSEWISDKIVKLERPELTAAKTVISGGRGVGSKDNFNIISSLADSLGAAVGASRAAVDAGYAPNDYQVGQTGKVVAPNLYMAVGISGAIQHLAGMKDSKTIVAINKDADAPIFQVADYGVVGDLFEVVPALQAKIQATK